METRGCTFHQSMPLPVTRALLSGWILTVRFAFGAAKSTQFALKTDIMYLPVAGRLAAECKAYCIFTQIENTCRSNFCA